MHLPFRDRVEAGTVLAQYLIKWRNNPDVLVLGLPRGGVPVAFQVATVLHARLDVYIVRKLGVPGHEELAFGAIASGRVSVINDDVVSQMKIPDHVMEAVSAREQMELQRREQLYRGSRPAVSVKDKVVILIDDGLATGATMLAGVRALERQRPARVVVAVPVAPSETCNEFQRHVDEIVCVATPEPFYGVGAWYSDFTQTSDADVQRLLEQAPEPSFRS